MYGPMQEVKQLDLHLTTSTTRDSTFTVSVLGLDHLTPTSSVIRGYLKSLFYVISNVRTLLDDASQLDLIDQIGQDPPPPNF